jgi:phage anti-repressor protein
MERKRIKDWHGNIGTQKENGSVVDDRDLIKLLEKSKSSEEYINKNYKEVMEDGWMDYQCNSCGKKIDPDDGYGDQKDYSVLIQELKDHQINHKFGESN